ncbi:MAG TPA: hypothetical protein VMU17_04205 [Elusimicrobiota bacterium]|nr:hypothetical protein [Elusimicrobiota bacterium]
MWASYLESTIVRSASDVERAGRSNFQFAGKVRAVLQNHPIQDWEADRWARGLRTGLLKMNGHFFRAGSGKVAALSLFIRNEQGLNVGLRREAITQAATYVTLVTDYGYSRDRTRFESGWMDVAVYDDRKQALIYAETKAAENVLKKLCLRLESEFADEVPFVGEEDLSTLRDDAIMKAHHIWRHRPRYFWAVCPTRRQCYEVFYRRAGFRLTPVENIPSAEPYAA